MDDLIDRALRHALAVTPSPEFVARVRTKIAEAPRPSMFPGMLKCAAAIACIAAAAIVIGVREQVPVIVGSKPSPANTPSLRNVTPGTATTASNTAYRPLTSTPFHALATVVVPTVGRTKAPTVTEKEPLPTVIIASQSAATVEHIIRNASEFVVSVDERAPTSAWATNDLTVAPITIAPLEPAAAHNN